jgi:hypothetical protein
VKRVAVLQSNYIPWKGYFDIIHKVDVFVFHDDLQYTHLDWRNRNKIKTPGGVKWLTIPCGSSEQRKICEVAPSGSGWQEEHWRKIVSSYRSARFFKEYVDLLEDIYFDCTWDNLSLLNQYLIKRISREWLGIETEFDDSQRYALEGKKKERLLELLVKVGATEYLSGPSAKDYLSERDTEALGIKLEWMTYEYPTYEQLYPPFTHNVSIIDLVFNTGPRAAEYIWGRRG